MFYIVFDQIYEIAFEGFDHYDEALEYIHTIESCNPSLEGRFSVCNVNLQKTLEFYLGK